MEINNLLNITTNNVVDYAKIIPEANVVYIKPN